MSSRLLASMYCDRRLLNLRVTILFVEVRRSLALDVQPARAHDQQADGLLAVGLEDSVQSAYLELAKARRT